VLQRHAPRCAAEACATLCCRGMRHAVLQRHAPRCAAEACVTLCCRGMRHAVLQSMRHALLVEACVSSCQANTTHSSAGRTCFCRKFERDEQYAAIKDCRSALSGYTTPRHGQDVLTASNTSCGAFDVMVCSVFSRFSTRVSTPSSAGRGSRGYSYAKWPLGTTLAPRG
jgi:hypothetical protein